MHCDCFNRPGEQNSLKGVLRGANYSIVNQFCSPGLLALTINTIKTIVHCMHIIYNKNKCPWKKKVGTYLHECRNITFTCTSPWVRLSTCKCDIQCTRQCWGCNNPINFPWQISCMLHMIWYVTAAQWMWRLHDLVSPRLCCIPWADSPHSGKYMDGHSVNAAHAAETELIIRLSSLEF